MVTRDWKACAEFAWLVTLLLFVLRSSVVCPLLVSATSTAVRLCILTAGIGSRPWTDGVSTCLCRGGGGFKETWVTAVVLTPGGGLELEYEVLCAFVHRQALP